MCLLRMNLIVHVWLNHVTLTLKSPHITHIPQSMQSVGISAGLMFSWAKASSIGMSTPEGLEVGHPHLIVEDD